MAVDKCLSWSGSAADPTQFLVDVAHDGGALAAWQVGSADEARAAADAGCDLNVAQGIEAGGHVRGTIALLPLLDAVLDAVSIPVVAAGGIGTARGLAAVLAAGASAARVGTRFVATRESEVHPEYREDLVAGDAADTVLTEAFSVWWPDTERAHRVLRSALEIGGPSTMSSSARWVTLAPANDRWRFRSLQSYLRTERRGGGSRQWRSTPACPSAL